MAKIACPLFTAATAFGDYIALIGENHRLSYREFDTAVTNAVDYLKAAGVRRGDRVAIAGQNRLEYVTALLALFRLGAVACLFSPRLGNRTLQDLASRSGCTSQLLCSDSDMWPDATALPKIDLACSWKPTSSTTGGTFEIDLDQPATIMTTSGSTGAPKLVLHSYGNHYYSALGSNENIPLQPGDRWLLSLSLHHVGGLAILFRCFLVGGTAVVSQPSDSLAQSIERYGITHVSVVATQLRRLLMDLPGATHSDRLASLKAVLLGGGPIDESLLTACKETGLPLFTSYGLTEAASQVCTSPVGSPGIIRPLKYRQVRLSDDGEILVTGETLFRGYVEGNKAQRPVDSEGWFHTGDMGSLDEDHGLIVTGRKDNMFVSGGENVHPEEIEFGLLRLEEIEDAVVVPIEDSEFDFRPVAFIRFASKDAALSAAELRGRLLDLGLPGFKIPVAYLPMPKNATTNDMKPDRAFLRTEAKKLVSGS